MKKIITLLILILVTSNVNGQVDSLTIFFVGGGQKGEKLKLIDGNGNDITKFKVKGNFIYKYKIKPLNENLKGGQPLSLHVKRKGAFSPFYHNVTISTYFEEGSKYIVFYRNDNMKNKVGVEFYWTNEEPLEIHVVDTNFNRES